MKEKIVSLRALRSNPVCKVCFWIASAFGLAMAFIIFSSTVFAGDGNVRKAELSTGALCFFIEDSSIPVIQLRAIIPGGTLYEKADKSGAGKVLQYLLRKGGTARHSPEEIDSILDKEAIDISFSVMDEMIEGSLMSLSKNADTALNLFFEMFFHPKFDEERLSVAKNILIDGIRRQNDTPGQIAHREFRKLIYGKESPWARTPDIRDIKKLSRAHIEEFYNSSFFYPDRMIIAVSGDFKKAGLLKKLEKLTADFQQSGDSVLSPTPVIAEEKPLEKKITKKFTQSAISIGHLGSTRFNPDKYALLILNDILGGAGSFNTRLLSSIRVKAGLAYEAWSQFGFGPESAPGIFQMHAKTKKESAEKVLKMMKDILADIAENGVAKEEFLRSKRSMLNRFIFEYELPFTVVSAVARFVYLGLGQDYLEQYKKGIEKVTFEEVNMAAKKYLHPDKLKVLTVGGK